ncbi:MAG: formate/nitrite transporter family protein [Syntrophomonadaceae bacterium]|nr:formate/nitrite transporter family protein [Syntrophomonadaceae bacterium]
MNFLSPAEIGVAACNAGKAKTEMPFAKLFMLGILAGVYIGFGANLATKIGSMEAAGTAGGQFLFGATFSIGLMMVVIAGSELFTGNNMACFISAMNGQAKWGGLLYNWVVVWTANFVGSVLLVYIIFYGGYWGSEAALADQGIKALAIAKGKMSLTWSAVFFRAICCNWLVCLAVWMAFAAKDIVGKIFAIFFPIMGFVSSGFEHCVANMFFIPMGITIANAAPEAVAAQYSMSVADVATFFSYGNFLTANLIPATLGNIVGGALFVGGVYYYIYMKKSAPAAQAEKAVKG